MRTFTATIEVETGEELDPLQAKRVIRKALDSAPEAPYIDFVNIEVICDTCDAGDPTGVDEPCE